MAKKPAAPAAATFEPDSHYEVTVSRVARAAGRVTFRPGQTYRIKGRVVDELGDAVATVEPVAVATDA